MRAQILTFFQRNFLPLDGKYFTTAVHPVVASLKLKYSYAYTTWLFYSLRRVFSVLFTMGILQIRQMGNEYSLLGQHRANCGGCRIRVRTLRFDLH